jgi:ubiquinone/menaquinone biosynthesis C-methylase UbiE
MTATKVDFTTRLFVEAGIHEGMRVLDVGCGSGDVSFLLAGLVKESGEVIGIDHDAGALAIAQKRADLASTKAPQFVHCGLTELPESLGTFDAIVGRRVLMYQADTLAAVRVLAKSLRPGGVMAFQEHDTTMIPASVEVFPLHRLASSWVHGMIEREGADLHIGFNLHRILTQAGLMVEDLRAECLLQTPDSAYGLGSIVRACLTRIVRHGVATAEEISIETLQDRLDAERKASSAIYIGDMLFGVWARKAQ